MIGYYNFRNYRITLDLKPLPVRRLIFRQLEQAF